MDVYDCVAIQHHIGCRPDITREENHIGAEGLHQSQCFTVKFGSDFPVFQRRTVLGIEASDVYGGTGNTVGVCSCNRLGFRIVGEDADNLKGAALGGLLKLLLKLVCFPQGVAGTGAISENA